jgi:hypothetical protein
MGHIEDLITSKFETNEEEPVFEEEEEPLKSVPTNDSNASSNSASSGK